jgi:hypothetical protein
MDTLFELLTALFELTGDLLLEVAAHGISGSLVDAGRAAATILKSL